MREYKTALTDYLNFREFAEGRTKETLESNKYRLSKFFRFVEENSENWEKPTESGVIKFLSNYSGQSFNAYLSDITVFYKWYLDAEEKPRFLKRIKHNNKSQIKRTRKYLEKKERIVTEEDYEKLIKSTTNIRNKAYIELLMNSGIRRGELLSTTNKSIKFCDDGLTYITVWESKTKSRSVPVHTSRLPYLEEYYLNYYPFKDKEEEYPLFYSPKNKNKPLSKSYASTLINRVCKESGVNRSVTPHDFRHTAITRDLKTTMTSSMIKERHGWVKGTEQLEVYDHVKMEDVAEYLRNHNEDMTPKTLTQLKRQNKQLEEILNQKIKRLEERHIKSQLMTLRLLEEITGKPVKISINGEDSDLNEAAEILSKCKPLEKIE